LALVVFEDRFQILVIATVFEQELLRPVGRTVVNNEDLIEGACLTLGAFAGLHDKVAVVVIVDDAGCSRTAVATAAIMRL
jgi:hypothetical protein